MTHTTAIIAINRGLHYQYIHVGTNGEPKLQDGLGVGEILNEYYTDIEKVEQLIHLGEIPMLKKTIEETKSSIISGLKPMDYVSSIKILLKRAIQEDVRYLYIYDANSSQWKFIDFSYVVMNLDSVVK